jgi:hypothetical protein
MQAKSNIKPSRNKKISQIISCNNTSAGDSEGNEEMNAEHNESCIHFIDLKQAKTFWKP